MTSDEQVFLSLLSDLPPSSDRRRSLRTPIGTVATVRRIISGEELNALHVLVMDVSEHGVGLRCPIGLVRGALYRVQIGHTPDENTSHIRVVTSRRRGDGSYDIGGRCVN